jgi:hypothetical protein
MRKMISLLLFFSRSELFIDFEHQKTTLNVLERGISGNFIHCPVNYASENDA